MANPPPSAGLNQDPKFLQALEKARMVAEKIKRETAEKMGGGDSNAPSTGLLPPSLGLPPPTQGGKRPAESDDSFSPKKPAIDVAAKIHEIRQNLASSSESGRTERRNERDNDDSHPRRAGLGFGSESKADVPKMGEDPPILDGLLVNGTKYLDMMIPGQKVGLIIGKGGDTIRRLQEDSGAKITIFQRQGDPSEVEKQLRIIGEPRFTDRCKQMILDLMHEKDSGRLGGRGGHNEYGSDSRSGGRPPPGPGDRFGGFHHGQSREVAVPPAYIGLVIGKGGESVRRIQDQTGARIQFDSNRTDSHGNKICCISGPPDCVRRAEDMIQEIIDNSAAQRGARGFMSGEEVRMAVPSNRCGAVIGRGGETIRVIKQQSGCDIEQDKKASTPDERVFIIRGTPDRVEVAKKLINEKVRGTSSPTPEPSGFGSQSGDYSWTNYLKAEHGIPPVAPDPAAGTSDAWRALYAQYYAGMAATQQPGLPTPGVDSANGQQGHLAAQAPAPSAGGDGPDYTQQWIEYYRAYGMHKEAEQIEAMARAQKEQQKQPGDPANGQDPKPPVVGYPGFNYAAFHQGNGSGSGSK